MKMGEYFKKLVAVYAKYDAKVAGWDPNGF
jgi:hypothetical protein